MYDAYVYYNARTDYVLKVFILFDINCNKQYYYRKGVLYNVLSRCMVRDTAPVVTYAVTVYTSDKPN